MPLLYRFKPIFLCLPGILCLPFVSLGLQIDTRAPETWVICVIRHNEQHPFLRLRYRFAPPTLRYYAGLFSEMIIRLGKTR